MRKITKLIFAGLLALAITPTAVLSLASTEKPMQVNAEEDFELVDTYQDFEACIIRGKNIKLASDVSAKYTAQKKIFTGGNIIIDLNGFNYYGNLVIATDYDFTVLSSNNGVGSLNARLSFNVGDSITLDIKNGTKIQSLRPYCQFQNERLSINANVKLNGYLGDVRLDVTEYYPLGHPEEETDLANALLNLITTTNSNSLMVNGKEIKNATDLFPNGVNNAFNSVYTIDYPGRTSYDGTGSVIVNKVYCLSKPTDLPSDSLNIEVTKTPTENSNGELTITNVFSSNDVYNNYFGNIETTWYRSVDGAGFVELKRPTFYATYSTLIDKTIVLGAKNYTYYAVLKSYNNAYSSSYTTAKYTYYSNPYAPSTAGINGQNNAVLSQDITFTGVYNGNQNNIGGNIYKYEYKWQKYNSESSSWQDISGATKLTYKPSTSSPSSSQYRFLVRAVAKQEHYSEWKASESYLFVVGDYNSPSVSLTTAESIEEVVGYDVNVSATVTNAGYFDNIEYQWYYLNTQGLYLRVKDGEHASWGYTFAGATTSTLTIKRSTVSSDPLVVRLQATGIKNGYKRIGNSVDSSINFVNLPVPTITIQPQSANLSMSGASHALSVTAKTLRGTLSYQWQKSEDDLNWENINGETQWNYQISRSIATEGTYYRCKVSNSAGDVYSNSALIIIKDGTVLNASLVSGLSAQFVDGNAGYEIDNENRTLKCHLGDSILIGFEVSEGNATTSEKSIGTDWRNETGLTSNGMGKYYIDTSMIGTFEYYGRFYAEYDNVGNFQSVCYDRTNTDSLRYMVTVLGREDETEIEPVSVNLGDTVTIYPADYASLFNNGVSTSSHANMYGNNWASSVYDFARGYRLFLGVPNEQEEIEYICVAKTGFYGQADPISYHYNNEPLEFSTTESALLELGITTQLSGAYDAYIVLDYLTIVNENDGGQFITKTNSYEGHHFSITFNAPCTHEHTTTTYTFDYSNPAEPEIFWNETCDECGEVIDNGFIRIYEEGANGLPIIEQAATCSEDGMKPHKHFTEGEYDIYYVQDGSGNWVVCDDPTTLIIKAKHTYTFVPEVPATKTTDGCRAHYVCNECGGLFILEDDVYYEVTEEQLIIKAEGYIVTFDANGGSGDMETAYGIFGDYILPTCDFNAPDGKMFDAWEVNGQRKLPNETISIESNMSIKALWKDIPAETFTVSFSANGGTGTMNPVSDIAGEYALPQCTFTAPEGKEFAGWKVNGQGNLLQAGEKINVTSNVDLVAQWKDKGGDTPATPDEPVTPEEPSKSAGLPAGAIVGIVIGSVLVVGIGGFALVWFVIKKKTWADFLALFKKK
ncbi:MAG: InlB B-repeat-containing protein [Bacilli bacterium]|nr:InlB B-repeat-containing protein [Bacilli bacterium]